MVEGIEGNNRLDSEWVTLNAVRELIRLATRGASSKSTYQEAIRLGGEICPEILGESSLIRASQESATTREFRQKAVLSSRNTGNEVTVLELLDREITQIKELLKSANKDERTAELSRRLTSLERARIEVSPSKISEHQAIRRDAAVFEYEIPSLGSSQGYSDFALLAGNVLRVRVFHPDNPEFVTGADIVYERHNIESETAAIVGVQYKIQDDDGLYLNDARMKKQLGRMRSFFCDAELCKASSQDHTFRFPFCSAFLRPTDRLQSPDQSLRTTGEHLPICKIESVKSTGIRGAELLRYKNIRAMSLSHSVFEQLFSTGKIGSRTLTYAQLEDLYRNIEAIRDTTRVLLHAKDLPQVRMEAPTEYD
ncbi:MAG: hypothetical protein AABP62_00600 [Planctomycetota bacterium]